MRRHAVAGNTSRVSGPGTDQIVIGTLFLGGAKLVSAEHSRDLAESVTPLQTTSPAYFQFIESMDGLI